MRAVIIDDEERSRHTLAQLLKINAPEVEILGYGQDVKSGLGQIIQHKPELVFLDVEMPDGTGFDLLKQIPNPDFEVVFTTAHDEHALKAFQFAAIAYLLKPIDEQELERVLQKVALLVGNGNENRDDQVNALVSNYYGGTPSKMILPDAEGFHVLETANIVMCKGEGNYTYLHLDGGEKLLSSKTLAHFEKTLNHNGFFRASKSHLINIRHVDRYLNVDGGTALMSDSSQVRISPAKRKEFKQLFS